MFTTIIICGILILLIFGGWLSYQRKLDKAFKEQSEREPMFDLDRDVKPGLDREAWNIRKRRAFMFMVSTIGGVIVIGALICGIMEWNAGAEQRQIAKAEKQRQAELEGDVALFSEAAIRKRFIKSQQKELDKLQAKLDKLEAEKQRLQIEWQNDLKKLSTPLKLARDSVYYRSLADLNEEQTEINSDIAAVQSETIEMWRNDAGGDILLYLFLLGIAVWGASICFGKRFYWSGAAVVSVLWIVLMNLVGGQWSDIVLILMPACVAVYFGYMALTEIGIYGTYRNIDD